MISPCVSKIYPPQAISFCSGLPTVCNPTIKLAFPGGGRGTALAVDEASFDSQTAVAPRAISSRHSRDFSLRQQDLSAAGDLFFAKRRFSRRRRFILCEAKIPSLLIFQLRQQPLPLLNQLLVGKFGYVLFPLALQQNLNRGNVRRHVLLYNLLFR